MQYEVIEPSSGLKQFIKSYIVFETNNPGEFPSEQRVFPHGNIELVFHYKDPFIIKQSNSKSIQEPKSFITGQQINYYDISPTGSIGMIFVIFQPYGARYFFSFPMSEFKGKNIKLNDVLGQEAQEIEDKVQCAGGKDKRVAVIEDYLFYKLRKEYNNHAQIVKSVKYIDALKGQIRASYLAGKACLSLKQFERKFAEVVGINPKEYLRIVRFVNTLELQKLMKDKSLAQLAYECGYYDQSHFINEFKSMTGVTPKVHFGK